jgi:enoyl-CoA hydratase/carnithine racemase
LKDLLTATTDQPNQEEVFQTCSAMMQLLPHIPQPTLCAVSGLATAAGCQLVAACDIVLAAPSSSFGTPGATTIGLFCHTPAVELVRSIGIKRALDMLYTGRVISAPTALGYGLISRMVDEPEAETQALARRLASQSGSAMQLGKQTVYQQALISNKEEAYAIANDAMVKNLQTRDAQHGIQSFLEKKKPSWKHK